jgi:hypothetical protein
MSIDQNDKRTIRCRKLGHEVSFNYCRQGSSSLPCRNIFNCWFETFDIEKFMTQYYNEEQIKQILTPSKPKLTSLVEIIEQARKNIDKADSD